MKLRSQSLVVNVSLGSGLLLILILSAVARNKSKELQAVPQEQTGLESAPARSGPFKYLPEGARIDDQTRDVVFADIDGDGQKEEIIFYSMVKSPADHKAGVLVLKSSGANYVRFWERIYDDSGGFASPTGIYDPAKTGKLQIFAYRTIGTSCPGVLDIFEYRSGKIEQIPAPWAQNGECQVAEVNDLNGDGNKEVIIKARDNGGVRTDIYLWNGQNYVQHNTDFSRFYSLELGQLFQDIHSDKTLPISARINLSKQAVRIYVLQRRYSEAIQLLEAVLVIIDNPKLTKPNSVLTEGGPPDQQEHILAWFEIEKNEGKSTIHRLLGDTFKTAGDVHRAQREFEEARTLESETNEQKNRIRP